MISRVAENCFWLHRYMERAENMARMLRVNRSFLLDVDIPADAAWRSVIVVAGEEERFAECHPGASALNNGDLVQDYLALDERCPVSIAANMRWARENARTIREVISLEMWEVINRYWVFLSSPDARRMFEADRDKFYNGLKELGAIFHGYCDTTMLREEPFFFMQLGALLERAGQTARILDVKYHLLGETGAERIELPAEAAHWFALLRSCSAAEPFFKRHKVTPRGRVIAEFLLKDPMLPRSVMHCLDNARAALAKIRSLHGGSTGEAAAAELDALAEGLRSARMGEIFSRGLHGELTRIVDGVASICGTIHSEYFDPKMELADAA
jgi:uncharacterized alpha-E superfamily protein